MKVTITIEDDNEPDNINTEIISNAKGVEQNFQTFALSVFNIKQWLDKAVFEHIRPLVETKPQKEDVAKTIQELKIKEVIQVTLKEENRIISLHKV